MKNIGSFWLKAILITLGLAFLNNTLKIAPQYLGFKAVNLHPLVFIGLGIGAVFATQWMIKLFKFALVFGLFTPFFYLMFKNGALMMNIKLDGILNWTLRTMAVSMATLTYFYGLQLLKYTIVKTLWTIFAPVRWIRSGVTQLIKKIRFKALGAPPCPINISLEKIDQLGNGDTYEKGRQFEEYIAQIYRVMGYNAKTTTQLRAEGKLPPSIQARGGSGEQGVDVIVPVYSVDPKSGNTIEEKILIQCKHYSQKVPNSAIQEIVAALPVYNGQKAVVITNNFFTKQARELAVANGVRILDRKDLAKLIENATNKYYEQYQSKPKASDPKKLVA